MNTPLNNRTEYQNIGQQENNELDVEEVEPFGENIVINNRGRLMTVKTKEKTQTININDNGKRYQIRRPVNEQIQETPFQDKNVANLIKNIDNFGKTQQKCIQTRPFKWILLQYFEELKQSSDSNFGTFRETLKYFFNYYLPLFHGEFIRVLKINIVFCLLLSFVASKIYFSDEDNFWILFIKSCYYLVLKASERLLNINIIYKLLITAILFIDNFVLSTICCIDDFEYEIKYFNEKIEYFILKISSFCFVVMSVSVIRDYMLIFDTSHLVEFNQW